MGHTRFGFHILLFGFRSLTLLCDYFFRFHSVFHFHNCGILLHSALPSTTIAPTFDRWAYIASVVYLTTSSEIYTIFIVIVFVNFVP